MSGLANMVFPDLNNPDRALLALLFAGFDLTESASPEYHLGRFRGSWFEKDAEGLICVFYTRNGGGNRECIHDMSGYEADERCTHEQYTEMGNDFVFVPNDQEPPEGYTKVTNIITGTGWYYRSDEEMELTKIRCLTPNSSSCFCYACLIEHVLPNRAQYMSDEDDDFDSTYATIRFRGKPIEDMPGVYDIVLAETGEDKVDMSERWADAIASITRTAP